MGTTNTDNVSTYDVLSHLSTTDTVVAFTDDDLGSASVDYCRGDNVLLVCRPVDTLRFLEGATLALAECETRDRNTAAILAARRLLPIDRLALALACNDQGVTATARELGVSPRLLRRRLDNLDAHEREYLEGAMAAIRRTCAHTACPRHNSG